MAALLDDVVMGDIQWGFHGKIALACMKWADAGRQDVVVDWSLMRIRYDAEAFIAKLKAAQIPPCSRRQFQARSISRPVCLSRTTSPANARSSTFQATAQATTALFHPRPRRRRRARHHNQRPVLDDVGGCGLRLARGAGASSVLVWVWDDFPFGINRKRLLDISGLTPLSTHAAGRPRLW